MAANMSGLTKRVPKPAKGSINSGLSACKSSTLRSLLGSPRSKFTTVCQPVTGEMLKRRIVTEDVGPFRVTGLDVAVASLRKVMARIKEHEPDCYASIGTAGMLCARLVRGSKSTPSNHSWGTAIDLTFDGVLDPLGDDTVQVGLLRVYKHFHAEGWFWGAGFKREDGMHFELADETVRRLLA